MFPWGRPEKLLGARGKGLRKFLNFGAEVVGSAFSKAEEGGAAAASWPPAGRFRGTPACLWVVPRCMPAWVAAGSIAATRNLMAAAASANCAVLVRHACDVPVRASLHVG